MWLSEEIRPLLLPESEYYFVTLLQTRHKYKKSSWGQNCDDSIKLDYYSRIQYKHRTEKTVQKNRLQANCSSKNTIACCLE